MICEDLIGWIIELFLPCTIRGLSIIILWIRTRVGKNQNSIIKINQLLVTFLVLFLFPFLINFWKTFFYSNRIDEKNIFNGPLGCNLWFREKIMNEDNKFPIFRHPICAGSSNSCYSRKNYGFFFWLSNRNQILVLSVLEV